jgi:hypothetical protein
VDAGSLFVLIGLRAAESDKYARASAIMKKRRRPFTSLERQGRTRNEDQEMKTKEARLKSGRMGNADAARGLVLGGKRRKK